MNIRIRLRFHVLRTGENEVEVDDKLRERSRQPLEKMLELAK